MNLINFLKYHKIFKNDPRRSLNQDIYTLLYCNKRYF